MEGLDGIGLMVALVVHVCQRNKEEVILIIAATLQDCTDTRRSRSLSCVWKLSGFHSRFFDMLLGRGIKNVARVDCPRGPVLRTTKPSI
jgi:hypothetical protein